MARKSCDGLPGQLTRARDEEGTRGLDVQVAHDSVGKCEHEHKLDARVGLVAVPGSSGA